MPKPPKWHQVYPQGTPQGDDEIAFFQCLERSRNEWVTVTQITKETNLSRLRIEQILNKYMEHRPPLVFQNELDEDQWAYWERVPRKVKPIRSIAEVDRMERIEKHMMDPQRLLE